MKFLKDIGLFVNIVIEKPYFNMNMNILAFHVDIT